MKKYKPVVLIILDGLGIAPDKFGSPWENAKHPVFSEMEKFYPFTALQASGLAVGLPWGEPGNSEVGHLTIGAGRIIYNYLPWISTSINNGTFFQNEAFLKAVKHVKDNNSSLHLMGLFSTGTVHAYFEHLYALLDLAKRNQLENVYLHLFTDGKDSYKKEGSEFFKKLENDLKNDYPFAKIASIIGRNFAMDRDGNWERTEKTYNLLVNGQGNEFESASEYIKDQNKKDISDDSIEGGFNKNTSRIKNNDAVIFFNFRGDSPRQITQMFLDKMKSLLFVTMTEYDKNFPCPFAFNSADVEMPLAKIISGAGLTQLHIAETEKYAHITYFINGGQEIPFEKEERILVPSLNISSYDQTPEMSAQKITEAIIANLSKYDFIVVNFANADMVGHTGNLEATAKAIEILDECIGKILTKVLELNGALVITADHGYAEEKIYRLTGAKKTKHSINPVPFFLISNDVKRKKPLEEKEIEKEYKQIKGTLTDVAPTILELLGIQKPVQMTGSSLISKME